MEIKIHNIENFLNKFTGENINIKNLNWIDPFGIAMFKTYIDTYKKNLVIHECKKSVKGYIEAVINSKEINEDSTYLLQQIGKTNNESVANFIIEKILIQIKEHDDKEDIKQYLQYMITEMIDNVVSHSCSVGYDCIAAQYYPWLRKVQVAIVDSGIGLMGSLKQMHNPDSEAKAISKALEKEITGSNKFDAYGSQKHAGLGLYFLKRIIEETKGNVVIISNDTIYININKEENFIICKDSKWKGTAIIFEFFIDSLDYEWSQIRNLIHNEVYSDDEEDLEKYLF